MLTASNQLMFEDIIKELALSPSPKLHVEEPSIGSFATAQEAYEQCMGQDL